MGRSSLPTRPADGYAVGPRASEGEPMRRALIRGVMAVLFCACGTPANSDPDGASDAGADAGSAVLEDAGPNRDAGFDAGADAGPACDCGPGASECCDGCLSMNEGGTCTAPIPGTGGAATCVAGSCVGETCECSSGPCCDGCFLRPATEVCQADIVYDSHCESPSAACPGYSARISESFGDRYCSGTSSACDGSVEHVRTVSRECWSASNPVFCEEIVEGMATCTHVCS